MRALVPAALFLVFIAACSSGSALSGPGLYIALGDSLSEGVGASDFSATAFVPLVHDGLDDRIELMNLGHSGDTSAQLIDHGHLDEAVSQIDERNDDDDPTNDVKLVTLEIGGNDLLGLFFSLVLPGVCPSVEESLVKERCVDALRETLDEFRPNLAAALDRLREADPDLKIVVMTLYNPFSGGLEPIDVIVELALEGEPDGPFPEGLNDSIRAVAEERGLTLVDWHPLFEGKAGEYIAGDLIHPNDDGYRVMADAVLEAVR